MWKKNHHQGFCFVLIQQWLASSREFDGRKEIDESLFFNFISNVYIARFCFFSQLLYYLQLFDATIALRWQIFLRNCVCLEYLIYLGCVPKSTWLRPAHQYWYISMLDKMDMRWFSDEVTYPKYRRKQINICIHYKVFNCIIPTSGHWLCSLSIRTKFGAPACAYKSNVDAIMFYSNSEGLRITRCHDVVSLEQANNLHN